MVDCHVPGIRRDESEVMMEGRQQSDAAGVSDWMKLLGFAASVLLGMALPVFLGVVVAHRLLPFGELNSWVHGWRAVLGILGIFLLWFFCTYITDRMATLLIDKGRHPLPHECAGEALSLLVLFALMSSLFTAWQAALLCAVLTSILTLLFGLAINRVLDRTEPHGESKDIAN